MEAVFDGCIMASSNATCTSPFQSGKRIKQQVTSPGTIDLVFDVSPTAGDENVESIYQVFHRLINVTGEMLGGFEVSLGVGVGSDFTESAPADGLRFATTADGVEFGPDKVAAFSQFPFGLFGGDPLNPNPLVLPGFFDTEERAGFNVSLGEDVIKSDGPYGTYDDLFGSWLSQDQVPNGLLYDYEDGKDPLVMAWASELGWEFLRCTETSDGDIPCVAPPLQIPADLNVGPLSPDPESFFAYNFEDDPENGISDEMMAYIMANLIGADGNPLGFTEGTDGFEPFLLVDAIEDLANLNLTFAIALDDMFASKNSSFTLRVTTYDVAPVPLPAAAPLLIAGLGALGFAARRRRKAA